ncbi:MAG: hypothetical protein IJ370_06680 [Oscillospiraceae bacterium]|nr:hypothetical protein [Oscillospiraceae bacterium]
MRKNDKNLQYEKCVMCGEVTDIPVTLPIGQRKNYVEGLGQLCISCKSRLVEDEQSGNRVSERELIEILNSMQKSPD